VFFRGSLDGKDGIGIGLAVQTGPGQIPVRDSAGNLVPIPDSGARNNVLEQNVGAGKNRWDGADENPACGSNRWVLNRFTTVNKPCVGAERIGASIAGSASVSRPAVAAQRRSLLSAEGRTCPSRAAVARGWPCCSLTLAEG